MSDKEQDTGVVETKPTPKKKARSRRRTVKTIVQDAFPNAPAGLINRIVHFISVKTLTEFREATDHRIEQGIVRACGRYANSLISQEEKATKAFLQKMQDYTESVNISFDSLFSARGAAAFAEYIRIVASDGKGRVEDIREILD